MNIILVSGDLAKVRTLTVSRSQLVLLATGLMVALALAAAGLQYLFLRHGAQSQLLQPMGASVAEEQQRQTESYVRGNLNAMAIRLGQMQAQLLRLDSLGERLAKLSGIKPGEFLFDQLPGRGGSVSALPAQDVTLPVLARQMDELARQVDDRFDKLGVLESLVMHERLAKKMLPSIPPIENGWYSSGFGWRIDPFTGRNAFHEGVDFTAEAGTAIAAAAGGIVVYADRHPEYGNMVEV